MPNFPYFTVQQSPARSLPAEVLCSVVQWRRDAQGAHCCSCPHSAIMKTLARIVVLSSLAQLGEFTTLRQNYSRFYKERLSEFHQLTIWLMILHGLHWHYIQVVSWSTLTGIASAGLNGWVFGRSWLDWVWLNLSLVWFGRAGREGQCGFSRAKLAIPG